MIIFPVTQCDLVSVCSLGVISAYGNYSEGKELTLLKAAEASCSTHQLASRKRTAYPTGFFWAHPTVLSLTLTSPALSGNPSLNRRV